MTASMITRNRATSMSSTTSATAREQIKQISAALAEAERFLDQRNQLSSSQCKKATQFLNEALKNIQLALSQLPATVDEKDEDVVRQKELPMNPLTQHAWGTLAIGMGTIARRESNQAFVEIERFEDLYAEMRGKIDRINESLTFRLKPNCKQDSEAAALRIISDVILQETCGRMVFLPLSAPVLSLFASPSGQR
jgi:hypothetical protein